MALGTADFRPSKGDLVTVVTDKYPSIQKGKFAHVSGVRDAYRSLTIEGHDEPIDLADVEIVAYNDGNTGRSK